MFSNNDFFQEITCPHIRKNTICNMLFCPFNHTYYKIQKEHIISKKQKYNHKPNIHSIYLPENHKNIKDTTDINNIYCNETQLYKKTHTNYNDCTIIHNSNITKENDISKNEFQDQLNTEDISPKFIPNLVHIPHTTRMHYFKLIEQEFIRLYSKSNKSKILAKNISLKKELEILNSTYQNKHIYINSCKNFIISLKKTDFLQENTVLKETKDLLINTHSSYKSIKIVILDLEKYLLSDDQLKEAGYILDIPEPETLTKDACFHCDRCNMPFTIEKNQNIIKCNYHWGNLTKSNYEQTKLYSCCYESNTDSIGCTTHPYHVFKITSPSKLAAQIQFIKSQTPVESSFLGAAVIDCEMIYTTGGMELARITIYDINENLLLDNLIKPKNKVIDFNTRWSGITSLENAKISLSELHHILFTKLKLCNSTILIGHGLENDLIAIRLIHKRIIDTAILFQDEKRPQHKYSLKYLAKKYLNRKIQTNIMNGHDSKEDAQATLDLLRYKIYNDNIKKYF
ncbi:hypothetical protein PCK1_000747 [Pneumocystis canis]|nr:hypothetical protein PCK1_000747 [Pneumocystis canis]